MKLCWCRLFFCSPCQHSLTSLSDRYPFSNPDHLATNAPPNQQKNEALHHPSYPPDRHRFHRSPELQTAVSINPLRRRGVGLANPPHRRRAELLPPKKDHSLTREDLQERRLLPVRHLLLQDPRRRLQPGGYLLRTLPPEEGDDL